jgi:ribonucleoside-diphosphate reductase alpha chain
MTEREKLPQVRDSITHRFVIAGTKGYVTASTYEDGRLGEIFIKMAKQGSVVSGMTDSLAICASIALQHGVPLGTLADKFIGMSFEPSGVTQTEEIPIAKSIVDYIFRWLKDRFGEQEKDSSGIK